MAPVSATISKTALLLIDIQNAFSVSKYMGENRNNHMLETNVQNLLEATRRCNADQELKNEQDQDRVASTVDIIHVRHHSTNPESPLHPSFFAPLDMGNVVQGLDASQFPSRRIRGIDAMPCAKEIEGEPIFIKAVNSAFIGTSLENHLRARKTRQLIVCGITTDHCVSTSTRMAGNLKVVDSPDGKHQGSILVIEDCCATFQRGEYSADLVHKVQLASLNGEFAEITNTQDVVSYVLTA